ncbi:MAG TPA: hypothetical protein VF472_21750 [Burkholderiaceae bacterium]
MKYVAKQLEGGEFAAGHFLLDTPVFIATVGGCRSMATAERVAAELNAEHEASEARVKADQVARGVIAGESAQ